MGELRPRGACSVHARRLLDAATPLGSQRVRELGPSLMAVAANGPELLEWRQTHSGREGVRFARCSMLDAVTLVRETVALLDDEGHKSMQLKPW